MDIVVKQITKKDESFFIVTKWMQSWWEKEENLTFDESQAIMERSISVTGFPRTYALFVDGKVVGAFQFTLFDLHVTPNLYPWLANVYIDREERGKGYSRNLLRSAVRLARESGIKKLWLFTSHVGLYEKYGFEFEGDIDTFTKSPRMQRLYSQIL